ncbi:oligopeptide/dipeptide ABC transporter ATP-binding protein [Microbispora triticiradicis]|nr:oligopeptide/dipeptide ABC transporter ATP-binding protein [Microbispora triticiradicis]
MYGGRVVEHGPVTEVLGDARHPYTRGLIRAIPRLTGDLSLARALPGRPPTLGTLPAQGCVFRERCERRMDVCETDDPAAVTRDGRTVACHATGRPLELVGREELV